MIVRKLTRCSPQPQSYVNLMIALGTDVSPKVIRRVGA